MNLSLKKLSLNAAVDYQKAELLVSIAVETQEKFFKTVPKSNLNESLLLQVATIINRLLILKKAAIYFEKFATGYRRIRKPRMLWV